MSAELDELRSHVHQLAIEQEGLKIKQEEQGKDIAEIKLQVTNHLVHQIAEVQASVDVLTRRSIEIDAVAKFASVVLKAVATVATVVWVVLQIIKAAIGWK